MCIPILFFMCKMVSNGFVFLCKDGKPFAFNNHFRLKGKKFVLSVIVSALILLDLLPSRFKIRTHA